MAWLGLDASAFHAGLRQSQSAATSVGRSIQSSLGGLAAGALGGFAASSIISNLIDTAENVRRLSKEFRVSTDTIQIWEKGAHKVNLTAEDIGNAMNKLKKSRAEAISGNKDADKYADAAGAFGIGTDELKNAAISTEAILDHMMSAVAGRTITDEQDVAGMELMGRSGAKILSAMEEIKKMGPIKLIREEDIESIHAANAALHEAKQNAVVGASWGARVFNWTTKFTGAQLQAAKDFIGHRKPLAEIGRDFAEKMGLVKPDEATPATKADETGTNSNWTRIVHLGGDLKKIEQERNRLAKEIAENYFRQLTHTEKIAELKKEIAEHERNAISEMAQGNDLEELQEKVKAEEARGKLAELTNKADKKLQHMDFNATERIGGFYSGSGRLASVGMDHAAKTALSTAETARQVAFLVQYAKGYIKDPNNDRVKNTMGAVHFG